MTTAPLNVFQKLMRRWETVHPYNAAQVMEVVTAPDASCRDRWNHAWRKAIERSGLGRIELAGSRYGFAPPLENDGGFCVTRAAGSWWSHASDELDRPFDPNEPPLRPFITSAGESRLAVGVVYRHWIADSVSIRMLMREWFMGAIDPAGLWDRPIRLAQHGYWNTVGPGRCGCGVAESISAAIRRQTRLRRAQKVDSKSLADYRTRFVPIAAPSDLLPGLKRYAHAQAVTLNDVFVAALAETCWRHVPLQTRPSRREVAVGSIVDLRGAASRDLSNVFGLFLGFTNSICKPAELGDFDRLVRVVSDQMRVQKNGSIAACSLMWMTAAATVGRWSKPDELYHFYRKDLPLAGGNSNVDLSRSWAAKYWPNPLARYIRISPTGPMTPMVVTTTTLGDRLDIGLTHRTGLICPSRAGAIGATLVDRLVAVAGRG